MVGVGPGVAKRLQSGIISGWPKITLSELMPLYSRITAIGTPYLAEMVLNVSFSCTTYDSCPHATSVRSAALKVAVGRGVDVGVAWGINSVLPTTNRPQSEGRLLSSTIDWIETPKLYAIVAQ